MVSEYRGVRVSLIMICVRVRISIGASRCDDMKALWSLQRQDGTWIHFLEGECKGKRGTVVTLYAALGSQRSKSSQSQSAHLASRDRGSPRPPERQSTLRCQSVREHGPSFPGRGLGSARRAGPVFARARRASELRMETSVRASSRSPPEARARASSEETSTST